MQLSRSCNYVQNTASSLSDVGLLKTCKQTCLGCNVDQLLTLGTYSEAPANSLPGGAAATGRLLSKIDDKGPLGGDQHFRNSNKKKKLRKVMQQSCRFN